jgi:UDP-N-acetylmuramoyl-L-alanyl-D-glutamate--2,6-diaminopimelate ligase
MPSSAGVRPSVNPGCAVAELARLLGEETRVEPADVPTTQGPLRVTGVTLDSREARAGDLYAALPGQRAHGMDFARGAVAAGAVAVLTDPAGLAQIRRDGLAVPTLCVDHPRSVLAEAAAAVYGYPAADVTLLGVTGTNGKTTTTYLMDAVLRAAGRTTGLIGTVETRVGDQRMTSVRTTPESPDLQALLATMRERGVGVCSMEVSSQALAQHRVDAAVMRVAGFTNFSQDHLELHGDMDSYLAAKQLLLSRAHSREAVVVIDDEGSRTAAARSEVPVRTLSGQGRPGADWSVVGRQARDGGTDFRLVGPQDVRLDLRCPMPGDFNVMNAALAAVMLLRLGLTAAEVRHGLARASGVPGRMERIGSGLAPLAVVDYAHTPQAVGAALAAVRTAATGRLVVVLGAGGDRHPAKRAGMGEAAARGADVVIVTDDNPRGEDPAAIRQEILRGARRAPGRKVLEIGDRRAAIREGIRLSGEPGDVLLVAGKGHEQGQEVAGRSEPFDDRAEVAAGLSGRGGPAEVVDR